MAHLNKRWCFWPVGRELSPRTFGASSSRPIACGNRVPPSDHPPEKLPSHRVASTRPRFAFRRCVRHKMEKELAHGGKIWYSLSVVHSCAQRKNWKDVWGSIALHSGEARSSGCRRCKAAGKGGCISQAKGQSHRLIRTRAPPGMRRARQRKMNAPEFCRQSLWWVLSAFLFCVRGGNLPCWNGSRRSTMQ